MFLPRNQRTLSERTLKMNVKLHNGKQVPKLDSHERKMVRTVANLLSLHMAIQPHQQGPESQPDPRLSAKAVLDGLVAEDVADPDGKSE